MISADHAIYSRRRRDIMVRGLCIGAALVGVTWLALILFTLFYNGLTGINLLSPKIPRRRDRPRAAC
jgi:hypothetical protein